MLPDILAREKTSLANISRLLGGQILQKGVRQEAHVYTSDLPSPDHNLTIEEAAEHLRFELQQAVRLRVAKGDTVSSDFGGGFDSSSLAYLTCNNLDRPLDAFVHFYTGVHSGDLLYAQRYAADDPRLRLHVLERPNNAIFRDLAHTPWHADLNRTAVFWKEIAEYYGQAKAIARSTMHFSGEGGDATLCAPPSYLADLLREGRLSDFLEAGNAIARLCNLPSFKVWRHAFQLARLSQADAIRLTAALVEKPATTPDVGGEKVLQWLPLLTDGPSWLTPRMRHELGSFLRDEADRTDNITGYGIADYQTLDSVRGNAYRLHQIRQYMPEDFALHAPYLDENVVKACLALPATKRANPYRYKPLLQKALRGVIPQALLERQSKGVTTSLLYASVRQAMPELQELFRSSRLADMGIIEPSRILDTLQGLTGKNNFHFSALNAAVAAELWVRGWEKHIGGSDITTTPQRAPIEIKRALSVAHEMSDKRYGVPAHIHAVASEWGDLALLDTQANKNHALDITGSRILRILAVTGNAEVVAGVLQKVYPAVPYGQLKGEVMATIKQLEKLGIIEPSDTLPLRTLPNAAPRSDNGPGRSDKTAVREPISKRKLPLNEQALAVGSFVAGKIIHRFLPQHRQSILEYLQEKRGSQEAAYAEAHDLSFAIQQTMYHYTGRVACLEVSYAVALLAAVKRQKVSWHIGAAFDPPTYHAWIAADERPVQTPFDPPTNGSYRSFFDNDVRY